MPTKRPRHTVTETDALADVLEQLRRHSRSNRLDLAELLRLGGEVKLREFQEEERAAAARTAARERFLERSRSAHGIDVDALAEARINGWSRD